MTAIIDWSQGVHALKKFNDENEQNFKLVDSQLEGIPNQVPHVLKAVESGPTEDRITALATLRILSRDRRVITNVFTEEVVAQLCSVSRLTHGSGDLTSEDATVVLEAEKVLCNLIFHDAAVRSQCAQNGTLASIIKRTESVASCSNQVQLFDMRILFGMTALMDETQKSVREELDGISVLCGVLENVLKNLNESNLAYMSWTLKVLYNLTVSIEEKDEERYTKIFSKLVDVLRELLLACHHRQQDVGGIVNLLYSLNHTALPCLLSPSIASDPRAFLNYNMEAVDVILDRLDRKLDVPHLKETLVPALLCLSKASRGSRVLRKYLKNKILPPLKDVMNRPEEGATLRNKLVRLMTSPIIEVKCAVADFLFVLCKEKVGRLIKYTGYGNAAGLLASRGLMLGGRGEGTYSSESEDSDTEEYTKYKDCINPVLGCYEAPQPNPTAGMTQEQKEHEAMQLVYLMDRLTRADVVKPCAVGPDGKPHPVEHVLQLLEHHNDSESGESESEAS